MSDRSVRPEPVEGRWTLAQSLARAQALGLDRIDAQLLHLFALGRELHDRAWLLAHDTDELGAQVLDRLEPLLQRRLVGEPLAYITGSNEFFGLPLQVDARVLDPRPDTETLVEWALDLIPADVPCDVIDLGTGSGAIALALQQQRPLARVRAVDASVDALAVARANAERLQLPVCFIHGHWLQAVEGRFADLGAPDGGLDLLAPVGARDLAGHRAELDEAGEAPLRLVCHGELPAQRSHRGGRWHRIRDRMCHRGGARGAGCGAP
jgi:hypothetical protein